MTEKRTRGFAGMSPEKRREIARKGGASVPDAKRSFSKDRELAKEAGRKGGENNSRRKIFPPGTFL
jgi:general stress protein YciG